MKKLFLFNFLLVMIFGLAINVNAASAPFYCMSFSSYADGAKADTMNEAISLYEGDQKQLYVYVARIQLLRLLIVLVKYMQLKLELLVLKFKLQVQVVLML